MSSRVRNIFFVIGVVAVIAMMLTSKMPFSQLVNHITQTGISFFGILVLWFFIYVLNTFTFRLILSNGDGKCDVPFVKLLKITITGFALTNATPVGLLGGEPYKYMELRPYVGGHRASSSVLVMAMMHVLSFVLFWLTGVFLFLFSIQIGWISIKARTFVYLMLFLISACCTLGIILFARGMRKGMLIPLLNDFSHIPWIGRYFAHLLKKHAENLESVDLEIASMRQDCRRDYYRCVCLEFLGRVMQVVEVFLLLLIFVHESEMSFVQLFTYAFLLLSFATLFANLLFFLPLQIGGREGGFMLMVSFLGMSSGIGVFIGVICRVRELLWTCLGLLLMRVGNKRVGR